MKIKSFHGRTVPADGVIAGFWEQGNGELSKRAISNEFNALTVDEIRNIEEQFQLVFLEN